MSEQQTYSDVRQGGSTDVDQRQTSQAAQSDATSASMGVSMGRRRSDRIVAASAAMQGAVDQATSLARTDRSVQIVGPGGSGRKHLARAIHQWSSRAGRALVEWQAAGTTETAQLRDLFGEPGAEASCLERALDGTLLIENADQLSPMIQARLMDQVRGASGRIRLLATVAGDGTAALGDEQVRIPALAERVEDILPLSAHFLAEFAAQQGIEPLGFTTDARRWLVEEPWTGNVRELRERIRQAIGLAGQGAISAEALMLAMEGEEVPSFKEAKRAFETRYVEGLLRRCSGNISRAARMARKDRKDFYDVIRRTGVDPGQFRG